MLTRISGQAFVLNCDLIERVDQTPDTVVTMVDGRKYVVLEDLHEVVAAVRLFRSQVVALSHHLPAEELLPPPDRRLGAASEPDQDEGAFEHAAPTGTIAARSAVVSLHSAPSVRNS